MHLTILLLNFETFLLKAQVQTRTRIQRETALPRESTGTEQVIRVKDTAKAAILLRQHLLAQPATASTPRTLSPTLQLRAVNLQLHQ